MVYRLFVRAHDIYSRLSAVIFKATNSSEKVIHSISFKVSTLSSRRNSCTQSTHIGKHTFFTTKLLPHNFPTSVSTSRIFFDFLKQRPALTELKTFKTASGSVSGPSNMLSDKRMGKLRKQKKKQDDYFLEKRFSISNKTGTDREGVFVRSWIDPKTVILFCMPVFKRTWVKTKILYCKANSLS